MVEHLTLLQIDPTAAIAPNADLVAWSRLGSRYETADLQSALEDRRTLFELDAYIRPMSDLSLYLADMARSPLRERTRAWLDANDSFRRDVLTVLDESGPLLSRDIADTAKVPWGSTGWTNNRNVTQMLELLVLRGEVAISSRHGRQRLWDLAERIYPPNVDAVPLPDAAQQRNLRRLRSLGIARSKTVAQPGEPYEVGEVGEPAEVEGTSGVWRVDPDALRRTQQEPFEGRVALLSPFDRLVHDRTRAQELFDFEYVLEMYKPADQRRWGYFALPILHHHRLVGKLDAKADRKSGILRVFALHEDVAFTAAMRHDVQSEIDNLAAWLQLDVVYL